MINKANLKCFTTKYIQIYSKLNIYYYYFLFSFFFLFLVAFVCQSHCLVPNCTLIAFPYDHPYPPTNEAWRYKEDSYCHDIFIPVCYYFIHFTCCIKKLFNNVVAVFSCQSLLKFDAT